jgi:hypothetical protein
MKWNAELDGMHVLVVPFSTGVAQEHFFWERSVDAWHPVTFSSTWQPTCIETIDGDASDDRVVVMGCSDGHLRKWDVDAKSDDGSPIDSSVLIGPLMPVGTRQRYRFMRPTLVMARDGDGCGARMYATDDPGSIGTAFASWPVSSGRNPTKLVGARGTAVYLELQNAHALRRWAYESGSIEAAPAGRA